MPTRKSLEANLATRNARRQLPPRKKPYERLVDVGAYLGYAKGTTGASWVARVYVGAKAAGRSPYLERRLGATDDALEANGKTVLTFGQAVEAVHTMARQAGREVTAGVAPDMTVDEAFGHYVAYVAAHRRSEGNRRSLYVTHIAPRFAPRTVASLTTAEIVDWHQALAVSKPTGIQAGPTRDEEVLRKRKVTANEALKCLRAALNHVVNLRGVVANKAAWLNVPLFRKVNRPRLRFLDGAEAVRLLDAAAGTDMADLVEAGLLTGLRWSELAERRVGDYGAATGLLTLPRTKHVPREVHLSADARELFARVCAGRSAAEVMFRRADGGDWMTHGAQSDPFESLALAAGFAVKGPDKVTFHTLRHTFASHMLMNGAKMESVAEALGHADIRMVSQTYGHLSRPFVAKQVESFAPTRARLAGTRDVVDLERERARRQARA